MATVDTVSKQVENRASFMKRVAWMAPRQIAQVELAYTLSKFYHRAQERKELDGAGNPVRYFEHPRRTALILIDELRLCDANLISTCLLHDVVEDTDLTPNLMGFYFDADVVSSVKILSKSPEHGLDKEGYHERLMNHASWQPLVVKGCDRLDNLRSMKDATPEFVRKQLKETRGKYYDLMDRLVEIAHPQDVKEKATLLRKMIRAQAESLDS